MMMDGEDKARLLGDKVVEKVSEGETMMAMNEMAIDLLEMQEKAHPASVLMEVVEALGKKTGILSRDERISVVSSFRRVAVSYPTTKVEMHLSFDVETVK